MRFSIKTLLILTTAIAITLACMMYPVPLVASAYYFAAVAAVFVAIIAAIQLRGSRRAFAVSFVIVAAGYLWLTTPNSTTQLVQAQLGGRIPAITSPLLTTTLLYCCYEGYVADAGQGNWTAYPPYTTGRRPRNGNGTAFEAILTPNLLSFLTIGHAMFAIWFGWLAGVLGRRLHTKGNDLLHGARPGA